MPAGDGGRVGQPVHVLGCVRDRRRKLSLDGRRMDRNLRRQRHSHEGDVVERITELLFRRHRRRRLRGQIGVRSASDQPLRDRRWFADVPGKLRASTAVLHGRRQRRPIVSVHVRRGRGRHVRRHICVDPVHWSQLHGYVGGPVERVFEQRHLDVHDRNVNGSDPGWWFVCGGYDRGWRRDADRRANGLLYGVAQAEVARCAHAQDVRTCGGERPDDQ